MTRALRSTDGIRIAGWMRTEFGLKGAELMTYALVFSFSQSNAGIYKGGVTYLASWLGCSYNSASKYLKSLVAKNLINEHPGFENNVPFCNYTANLEVLPQILGEDTPNLGDRKEREKKIYNNTLSIKGSTKFQKPSLEDVRAYCISRGNQVDPEQFCNFYESNGWKVGKNPMKDWRAAVRTWEKREKEVPQRKRETKERSVLEHNLKVMDELFGTNLHEKAYGGQANGR